MSDFVVVEGVVFTWSNDKGTSVGAGITSNPIDANTEALHVDGSKVTQPVSAASLPLPSGAATEATLTTIDADTGQLVLDMAELLLRFGDNVASPAADSLLARIQEQIELLTTIDADTSNLDVALSTVATAANQTNGNQQAQVRSGTKGTSTPADITSTAIDANREALHVDITAAGGATEATLSTIDADTGQLVIDMAELLARFGDNVASPSADSLLARVQELIDNIGEALASPVADTVQGRLQEQIDLQTTMDADTSQMVLDFAELLARFGDNVASPAADSLLARVQELIDNIGAALASPVADTVQGRLQEQIDLQTTIDADTSQLVLDLQDLLDRFGDNVASPTADSLLARVQEVIDQQTDGTQRARVRSSTKGTSTEADVTSRNVDANIEALHVDATHTVQPVEIKDEQHGLPGQFSLFGLQKVAHESVLADLRFDRLALRRDWNITRTGGANYQPEPGGVGVKLFTQAAVGSKVTFETKVAYRYESGRGMLLKMSAILGDTGVAGNVREWGFRNDDGDGLFMRMDGTTLKFVHSYRGSETEYAASAWDTPTTIDANGHLWFIQYPWLGVADFFVIHDLQVVHRIPYLGTSTSFSLGNPDMKVFLSVENVSNSSSVYLKSGCASVCVEGGDISSGTTPSGGTRPLRVDDEGYQYTRITDGEEDELSATLHRDSPGVIELATRDATTNDVLSQMLAELRTIRFQLGHATEVSKDEEDQE